MSNEIKRFELKYRRADRATRRRVTRAALAEAASEVLYRALVGAGWVLICAAGGLVCLAGGWLIAKSLVWLVTGACSLFGWL